jgi:DNA-binding NarL/FixJ family response regulator
MSYTFLVVDDTSFMRKMAADYLKQGGHTVIGEATNGKEAIRLFEETKPDIVLMDLTMPEMSGIEAIQEILRIDSGAIILVCTASNQQDLISGALEAGAKGYLLKPFYLKKLNEIIEKYAAPFIRPASTAIPADTELAVEEDETEGEADVPEEVSANETNLDTIASSLVESMAAVQETAATAEPMTLNRRKGEDRMRSFVTSLNCSWEEEKNDETILYNVMCTEKENKIMIEMSGLDQNKQTIHFSIDGFRQLSDWLEEHVQRK